MRDYIELSCVPFNEECQQVGSASYDHEKACQELRAYRDQLARTFPEVEFAIKWFDHDYGRYGEVVAYYDSSDEASVDAVIEVDLNVPGHWDATAKEELYGADRNRV